MFKQAVNSREFDYSHFVSLPLAIHPGLVEKLVNFQNIILGADASDRNENEEGQCSSTACKVSISPKDVKAVDQVEVNITSDKNSVETPLVSVELNPEHADAPPKVNITDIPFVSYIPKESKAPASQTWSPTGIFLFFLCLI